MRQNHTLFGNATTGRFSKETQNADILPNQAKCRFFLIPTIGVAVRNLFGTFVQSVLLGTFAKYAKVKLDHFFLLWHAPKA